MVRVSQLWLTLLMSAPIAFQAVEIRRHGSHGNPIRKVVNLLQSMSNKVEKEGEREQKLFDKFMCYCKTGGGKLQNTIADSNAKIPELESAIKASVSKKTQLDKDLEDHRTDRAATETAMAEATVVRDKEMAEFKKESAETKAEMAQMAKALASLEGGVASAFLQTSGASELGRLVSALDMAEEDRQAVLSFLSGSAQQSAPGEVVGILKTMQEEMAKGASEAEAGEAEATKTYNALMNAKKKEAKAATRMTEEKLQRVGELAIETETLKNELSDTKDRLTEDSKMLATLRKSCATKQAEVEKSKALRQQELLALSETIKVLNDDDALQLFKKTLPGSASSFLQIQVTERSMRHRALKMLRMGRRHSAPLDFIALALRGKKVGFEGVIQMVDKLAATLHEEQAQDNKKKDYCAAELEKSDDKKKDLERSVSDTNSAIGKAEEDVVALAEAVKKLTEGIKDLDRSVAEATEQRKEEHAEYSELMQNDNSAKELLGFAKNRLQKFYNPTLYKPPPQKQLSEEDRIIEAHAGASSFVQKAAKAASGVIALIDLLIADLDKEMTEAEVIEKASQEDYEQATEDAAAKRASDSKALAESQSEKADLESSLEELVANKKSGKKELAANGQYIMALHRECDWLLQYFDVRKEARAGEVDNLTNAKAVLSGADYSFLQVQASTARANRFLGQP